MAAQVKVNQRGKLRSVVNIRKFHYTPIIVSDSIVIGNIIRDNIVVVKEKEMRKVLPVIKAHLEKEKYKLPPAIVLVAGNEETSARGYGLINSNVRGKEHVIAGYMVEDVMEVLREIECFIKSVGGKLIVAPLIPRPAEQCFIKNLSTPLNIQELLSEAYVDANMQIRKLNRDNRVSTPPIDTYLEKSRMYKNRKQKMIEWNKYKEDLIRPVKAMERKLSTILIKTVEALAANR